MLFAPDCGRIGAGRQPIGSGCRHPRCLSALTRLSACPANRVASRQRIGNRMLSTGHWSVSGARRVPDNPRRQISLSPLDGPVGSERPARSRRSQGGRSAFKAFRASELTVYTAHVPTRGSSGDLHKKHRFGISGPWTGHSSRA